MSSDAARKFLDNAIAVYSVSNPELTQKYSELNTLYEKRLWHNLTVALYEFVQLPQLKESEELIKLYTDFIRYFETKINQLTFAQIAIIISRSYKDISEAIKFLEAIAIKVGATDDNLEPTLLIRSVIVQLKLRRPENLEECKGLLESVQSSLEGITGIDTTVYMQYYKARAQYHKLANQSAEFYRNALLFLTYTALETLTDDEKRDLAFDIGISALVGEDIYSFGDLLAHPIIESLRQTDKEWLAELVFSRQAIERTIPFALIAETTNLPLNMVELLVMKALSLGLIKGAIDQVEQTVNVLWVQSRVLGLEQITKMRDRLDDWTKKVNSTLLYMEQGTPELFS